MSRQSAAGRTPVTSLNGLRYSAPISPDQNDFRLVAPIPIADARRRIREVQYERGTIVNPRDVETKEMADCRRRYDSFNKSEVLKGKVYSNQLAQLGLFFVAIGMQSGSCAARSAGAQSTCLVWRRFHIWRKSSIGA